MTLFDNISPGKATGFLLVILAKVLGLSGVGAGFFSQTRDLGAVLLGLAFVCIIGAIGIGLHFRSVEGKEDSEVARERSKIRELTRERASLQAEVERYRSQLERRDELFSKYAVRAR